MAVQSWKRVQTAATTFLMCAPINNCFLFVITSFYIFTVRELHANFLPFISYCIHNAMLLLIFM